MADTDYTIRTNINPMCPNAFLVGLLPCEEGPSTVAIERLQHVSNDPEFPDIVAGSAVMIQDEICKLVSINTAGTEIVLARGCADTIPQEHSDGAIVWFFQEWTGSDKQEYLSGETIGVKALPTTVGSNTVPVNGVPPNALVFNSRQIRPYVAGALQFDGAAWFNQYNLALANTPLDMTWAHRDRVGQHDILVSHPEASTGPEAGTTYSIRVFSTGDTMLREETGITADTWSYSLVDAQADFGITAGTGPATVAGYITFEAVRDGHVSWSKYRTEITVSNEITPP